MNPFKNLLYIIIILVYYMIESIILGIPIYLIWRFKLELIFKIHINYIDWVYIIWIIKVLFFDIFKISSFYTDIPNDINNNNKNNDKHLTLS